MRNVTLILLFTFLLSTLSFAHGNLEHVLGTVVEVTDHSISIKVSDGSTKVVAYDAETHFLKGGSPASAKDVQVGIRVAIHAHKDGDNLRAAEVKIAPGPTPPHP